MKKAPGLIVSVVLAMMTTGGGPLTAAAPMAGPPPVGGTVSIQPETADDATDVPLRPFADAMSEALTARGFTVLADQGHAAAVVELLLSRADVGTGLAKAPGRKGASIIGTGVAVPLGTGDSEEVAVRRTRLEMRVRRRGETGVAWDGAAVTVRAAGNAKGSDEAVASDLTRALLSAYPEQPKDVIGVP